MFAIDLHPHPNCELTLRRGWLHQTEADRLLSALVESVRWEQRSIRLFGKTILQPRLLGWAGELPYRYSGQTLEPRVPPAALAELLRRVNEAMGHDFNHVLLNRYRDGRDSMGWHTDNEPELGDCPQVAILSLGATRTLRVKPRRTSREERGARHDLALDHGSLLFMGGEFQRHFVHAVPKTAPGTGERVSMTFRRILSPPSGARVY